MHQIAVDSCLTLISDADPGRPDRDDQEDAELCRLVRFYFMLSFVVTVW